ncbi:E3 ubiquitin-protein ligase TRIM13-like, partial [Ruditapes philippinarum]|uniref:E3 ubiquitin-protein ligase TRIM13-like n=1 Tax=Ruditapes philippinarum TaxID=129788 RepID=UPI00295A9B89
MSSSELETCILDCPLCLKTYEDPRILPCQHSACEKCLSSYIKHIIDKGDQQTGLPCPVCNRKTKLRDASSFKKSLTIVALLDSKHLKAKIQKASAKKKSNARTIATQTGFEETYIESKDKVNVMNNEKDEVNRKKDKGKHLENGNHVMLAT